MTMKKPAPRPRTTRRPTPTLVTFLLDRTGSMEPIRDVTIGAYNDYLGGLTAPAMEFSLLLFDSQSLDKVHVGLPPKDVPRLTRETYIPRAATPLIDAVVKTIKAVDGLVAKRKDKPKVVVCIQTDGYENASTEHTWEELNALIKARSDAGWQFNFMGASIDAYKTGARMGIARGATVSYDSLDPAATRRTFIATASNNSSFAAGQSANTAYTVDQKVAAGDAYDPDAKARRPKAPEPKPVPAIDDFSL